MTRDHAVRTRPRARPGHQGLDLGARARLPRLRVRRPVGAAGRGEEPRLRQRQRLAAGAGADPASRDRPAPDVWSPLEYACHVRDVHRVFAERVRLMLAEDDPLFDDWDQDAAAVARRVRRPGPGHRGRRAGRARPPTSSERLRPVEGRAVGPARPAQQRRRCSPSTASRATTCTTSSTTSTTSPDVASAAMRHTEFWARMEHALGRGVRPHLGRAAGDLRPRRTAPSLEALDAGETPKQVWRRCGSGSTSRRRRR